MLDSYPPELQAFVQQKIAAGVFQSVDEFAIEAAQLYREIDSRREEIRSKVAAGMKQLESGEYIDIEGDDELRKRYRLTKLAIEDIDSAWSYIAKDRPSAADRFVERLSRHFALLAENPHIGELRQDLAEGVRQSVVGSYVVLHLPCDDLVQIVRVIHGARDIFAEFRKHPSR
jgi:toxin ParE1/3/4